MLNLEKQEAIIQIRKDQNLEESLIKLSKKFIYYENLKRLARRIRKKYGISKNRVMPSEIKKILKMEGVEYIDLRNLKKVRGIYFNDETGITIVINKNLPTDPRAFTLAHELKHHLVDKDLKYIHCGEYNVNEAIEIGAEIFAAEFLFPEEEFKKLLSKKLNNCKCTPKDIVWLKKITKTTLSYAGLSKRAVFLKYIKEIAVKNIKWKKLEEKIYGIPYYKKRKYYH